MGHGLTACLKTRSMALSSQDSASSAETARVAGHKYPFESPESHEREMMAEIIKIRIGSAVPLKKNLEVKLRSKAHRWHAQGGDDYRCGREAGH
jgi:hypothetical protein